MALRSFYADDCLRSFNDVKQALASTVPLMNFLSGSSFQLTKFVSTSEKFLAKIPNDRKRPDLADNVVRGKTMSALGLPWHLEDDTLSIEYQAGPEETVETKRQLLSVIASHFNPLGLVGFALVRGKIILQSAFRLGCSWDQTLPDHLLRDVRHWLSDLKRIESLRIPRPLCPPGFGSVAYRELHTFADSSTLCMAAMSYLRSIDASGNITVQLVASRNRLAPIKGLTVPRLELSAALLAARLGNAVKAEMNSDVLIQAEHYWSDSTAVLAMIGNVSTRFNVFVSNRLQEIQDTTSIDSWHYVPTKENVADGLSRGLIPEDVIGSSYFNGPHFIALPPEHWPATPDSSPDLTGFEDERLTSKDIVLASTTAPFSFTNDFFPRYDRLSKLKVAIACLNRFITLAADPTANIAGPMNSRSMNSGRPSVASFERFSKDTIGSTKCPLHIHMRLE